MTIEITEKKDEEVKPVEPEQIKDTLKAADEYEKKKAEVEKLEALYAREQEIRAKMAMGGTALAGKAEESEQDKVNQEAANILKPFKEE